MAFNKKILAYANFAFRRQTLHRRLFLVFDRLAAVRLKRSANVDASYAE